MTSINLKRSVATLAVAAGLLAAAAPSAALAHERANLESHARASITMLDYEGSPVVTPTTAQASLGREGSIEALG